MKGSSAGSGEFQIACSTMTATIGAKQRRSCSISSENGLSPFTRHTAPAAMAVHTTWPNGASKPRMAKLLNMPESPSVNRYFMA